MKKSLPQDRLKQYIPYAIIAVSFVIILIRGFYSFCWSDESFYFSTADRFYKGDSIFFDDWFPTQLSGVFILPFYSLFHKITGSASGIILFFRILYSIFELICGLIIYKILKEIQGIPTALCISLLAMFYTHLNIATISYYTMSLLFYILSMVLIYSFYCAESKTSKLIIAGVCFAISVLNIPPLAAAYIFIVAAGFILCLAAKLFKVKSALLDSLKLPTLFKYTLIGILIPAVIFAIYMLSTVSIPDFIRSIPYILSDDEHIISDRLYPVRKMYLSIIESYGHNVFHFGFIIVVASICSWILSYISNLVKKTDIKKAKATNPSVLAYLDKFITILNTVIIIADVIAFIIYFVKSFGHTGYINTAIMLFSIPFFFISDKKDVFAFIVFFLSGMMFTLVYAYGSNGMLYVLAMGHFIASIGGIIFMKDFINGLTKDADNKKLHGDNLQSYVNCIPVIQKSLRCVIFVVICVSLLHTIVCRINNVYRDDRLSNLTAVISDGPAKYLHTNPEHKKLYDEVYIVLTEHCQDGRYFLISKILPWGYMCTDMRAAAPTTWRNKMDNPRLPIYYELHPDRLPDTILLLDDQYGKYEKCGDVDYDPNPNANDTDGYIYDYIADNDFEETDVACGKVFKKKN